jgi:glycine/D-amino acid oxidase-like deaminating enzyme
VNGSGDVVIVGGGVIGCAVAYFLLAEPAFGGSVVVVERDPTYRQASSALSASSIRQQFSTPESIAMSRFGFDFLTDIGRHLAIDGRGEATPDIGLVERGYLYLATSEGETALRASHAIQVANGAAVTLLGPDDLAARFPWLTVDDLALGSLGSHGEGWFDGYGLMRAFRSKAQSMGATIVPAEVVGVTIAAGRVAGVELDDGSRIGCAALVDAAGPWAARVAAMAGVAIPVEARRRSVFVFDAPIDLSDGPLVVDTSGAWFRPEGRSFIGSIAPTPADDVAGLPLEVDHRLWEDRLWPALAGRVPAFDAVRVSGSWAGYYEVNTFDHNAILGPHPEIGDLLFAVGFSGHGLQHAPAVGRAIAELITHGRSVSLDLSVFGIERLAAGRRIVERNVIG